MADNYLEKRQEAYLKQASKGVARKAAVSLAAMLAKCESDSFDGTYKVRADQLERVLSVIAPVAGSSICGVALSCDAVAMSAELRDNRYSANAYIFIGAAGGVDECVSFLLGRVVQLVQLQCAEIGLATALTFDFDRKNLSRDLNLSFEPYIAIAVGKCK